MLNFNEILRLSQQFLWIAFFLVVKFSSLFHVFHSFEILLWKFIFSWYEEECSSPSKHKSFHSSTPFQASTWQTFRSWILRVCSSRNEKFLIFAYLFCLFSSRWLLFFCFVSSFSSREESLSNFLRPHFTRFYFSYFLLLLSHYCVFLFFSGGKLSLWKLALPQLLINCLRENVHEQLVQNIFITKSF